MITVGVNYGVILANVEFQNTDKFTALAFTFKEAGEGEVDEFEALASGEEVVTGNGIVIRRFGPGKVFTTTPKGDAIPPLTQTKSVVDALGEVQNTLRQFLQVYMTTDKIKFNMFAGMESVINKANYSEAIREEAVINTAFSNLCTQFVEQVTPFLNDAAYPLNVILVRQSKTKHFPEFRKQFVRENPIVESGKIAPASSKLKFTSYEITQGLNDGTPVAQTGADTIATSETTQADVDEIFGTKD